MFTHHTPSSGRSRRVGTRTAAFLTTGLMAITALTGCSSTESATVPGASGGDSSRTHVVMMGDSTAGTESPAVEAALRAAGASFENLSSDGGGTVVEGEGLPPFADSTFEQLASAIAEKAPSVVVYQLTLFDWGTPEEQQAGYRKLVDTAKSAGAKTVFVTAPPSSSSFFDAHRAEMATAPDSARKVVADSNGNAMLLDASEVWGTDATAPAALRSADQEHNCQQGAAKFAVWLGAKMEPFTGLAPVDPAQWAQGDWTGDPVYAQFDCPAAGQGQ